METNTRRHLEQLIQSTRQGGLRGTRETSYGTLYEPRPFSIQISLLIGAFVGGPLLGWLMRLFLGGSSSSQQLFPYIPPTLIFFLGYALWAARLSAIAFDMIGKSILRLLFHIIIRRKKPERLQDFLPDREKLEQMAVRAQKAGWSFFTVAVLVGIAASGLSILLSFGISGAFVMLSGCLLWGYLLGRLARRGYLPFPESGD